MERETSQTKHDEGKLSICDIMKEDTSMMIKAIESKTPGLFQNYSDLYKEYLHMFDDMFGICYIAEKKFFDNLNIDQGILKQIKANSESMRKNYIEILDVNTKLFDGYVKMRIDIIKSFDSYVHTMMDMYTKMWAQFNETHMKK
ncbi:MAG: hypothetical protein HC806_10625 [Anaerolineae bacterium]|nr:hypothetical protein [Anaerolineae bacterium]